MAGDKSDMRKRDALQVALVGLVAAVWVTLTAVSVFRPDFPIPVIYHALMVGDVIWVATGSFPNILGKGRSHFSGSDEE